MLRHSSRLRHLTTPFLTHQKHASTKANHPTRKMTVSPPSAERSAELADNYNQILKEVNDAAAAHPGKFKVGAEYGTHGRVTVGG